MKEPIIKATKVEATTDAKIIYILYIYTLGNPTHKEQFTSYICRQEVTTDFNTLGYIHCKGLKRKCRKKKKKTSSYKKQKISNTQQQRV